MDLEKLFAELKNQLDDDGKASSLRTAILWGREDLLGGAVEALLIRLGNWRAIRIFDDKGIEALTRVVECGKPNLMVVNQNHIAGDIYSLTRLIQGCPELKIITVNPVNNLIEVYDKHRIQVREISDLLSAIDENPKSALGGGEKK